ncbi:MAG: N-acetylglucosamine-6-phosphate deacetylase [Culicoidibacterales bacterium]
MKITLKNGKVILPYKIIENGFVRFSDGKIIEVGHGQPDSNCPDDEIIDVQGNYIAPGFIDQHIHGGFGADCMDANITALGQLKQGLLAEGTTSFLATTMTEFDEAIEKALKAIVISAQDDNQGANIIGIHQEGPFISKIWKGAQREDAISPGSIEKMDHFIAASAGMIRLITYAIENTTTAFTRYLRTQNIVASVGHSNATFSEVEAHVEAGLNNLTHFHNASSPHHHRNPGIVTAGFYFNELQAELIVDGIHLHPDAVKATYKIKGADNIILITDSIRAKGMADGVYDLGGQAVHKVGPEARLADGTLAGSVLLMNDAVKNMMSFTNCSLVEAIKMASYNPANHLGFGQSKGCLAPNFDADIIVFDQDINIRSTYVAGKLLYTS